MELLGLAGEKVVEVTMEEFFIEYFAILVLFIALGIAIKVYFKKTGLGNSKRVLSMSVFWLKFMANSLLIIGSFLFLVLLTTLYYHLKYEGYL